MNPATISDFWLGVLVTVCVVQALGYVAAIALGYAHVKSVSITRDRAGSLLHVETGLASYDAIRAAEAELAAARTDVP